MHEKSGEMENDPSKPNNNHRSTIPVPQIGGGAAAAITGDDDLDEGQAELLLNVEEGSDIIGIADIEEYGDDDIFDEESMPFGNEEFSALNRQLDQLQSALDEIESRNADIHKELLEILHSNREVRRTMREEAEGGGGDEAGSSSSNNSNAVPDEQGSCNKTHSSHSNSDSDSVEVDKMTELMLNACSVGELIQTIKGQIDKD